MLVSHSQDFLNGVCTNIIHLHLNGLRYYRVREGGRKGGRERERGREEGLDFGKWKEMGVLSEFIVKHTGCVCT